MINVENCDECGYRAKLEENGLLCCHPKSICYAKIVEPLYKCGLFENRNKAQVDSEAMKIAFELFKENKQKC